MDFGSSTTRFAVAAERRNVRDPSHPVYHEICYGNLGKTFAAFANCPNTQF